MEGLPFPDLGETNGDTTSRPITFDSLSLVLDRIIYLGEELSEGEGGGREGIKIEEREQEV